MTSLNRSVGRNIHIYNANDPTTELGGLILTNGVTNANFYSMVEILFIFESTFFLRDEGSVRVQRDEHQLQPGNYYIVATGGFALFYPFMVNQLLSYKQVPFYSIMSPGCSVRFLCLTELELNRSVMLSVHETVDALSRGKWQLMLILATGRAYRLRISFR